jgi:pyruvate ferredoxin oxidoreductase alpha subunit/phenylglyoxylate dehydrogenase alpha subunit
MSPGGQAANVAGIGNVSHQKGLETEQGKVLVINGNKAAAYGAKLCRPTVLAAYPITPQTPLVEYLSTFVADGELEAEMVEVESEHSALSVLEGAALVGARVFTGTSSQGLALMYEPYIRASTMRLPIVMAIVTREVISPQSVWGGQQDAMTVRDAGWIQLWVEDNQEVLDTVIMAYKIAEDPRVLLPVNVCYDGFYLSHMAERVVIPHQHLVDEFLPPPSKDLMLLDPDRPVSVDPLTPGSLLMEYRYKHMAAMMRAKEVIEEVDRAFGEKFGRSYGGLLESYRLEDAEIALVTVGSVTGTARVAVDRAREAGVAVGLLKIKAVRPFPAERVVERLKGLRAVGVVDRSVSFGWNSGLIFTEMKIAFSGSLPQPKLVNFIDGLGGADITLDHLAKAIEITQEAGCGAQMKEVHWLGIAEPQLLDQADMRQASLA